MIIDRPNFEFCDLEPVDARIVHSNKSASSVAQGCYEHILIKMVFKVHSYLNTTAC